MCQHERTWVEDYHLMHVAIFITATPHDFPIYPCAESILAAESVQRETSKETIISTILPVAPRMAKGKYITIYQWFHMSYHTSPHRIFDQVPEREGEERIRWFRETIVSQATIQDYKITFSPLYELYLLLCNLQYFFFNAQIMKLCSYYETAYDTIHYMYCLLHHLKMMW